MDYIISLLALFHLVPLHQIAVFKNKPEHLTFLSSIQPVRYAVTHYCTQAQYVGLSALVKSLIAILQILSHIFSYTCIDR